MDRWIFALLLVSTVARAQVSPHGNLARDCQACHSTDSWTVPSDGPFNHETVGFPLAGKHSSLGCRSCHQDLKFTAENSRCAGCHRDIHKGELGVTCARCHTSGSWQVPDMVQRHQTTRFPLLGRHASLACESCHMWGARHQYVGTPTTCVGCHSADYQETRSPAHAAARFPTNCQQCHEPSGPSWSRGFDHSLTGFPLTGAHLRQTCFGCHGDNVFTGKPSECIACHLSAFTAAQNPNHLTGGFPRQCLTCHSTNAWTPSVFSHTMTRFPLTGAHVAVACSECHLNNQYQGLPSGCYDCHAADFQSAGNPSHIVGNFSHDCTQCHTTSGWSPATFNHGSTAFALTGAHVPLACQSCHTNGNYQLVYAECYQCHQTDFALPTNPNHVTLLLSHSCEQCHSTTVWRPSTFNHDAQFFRVYSGTHRGEWTECTQCHQVPGNFQSFTCLTCHVHNQQTMDSAHRGRAGYSYSSPACYNCHRNS